MPAGLDGNSDPLVTEPRTALIERVADAIEERRQPAEPLLVAIDGIDGSGKSTFADEIVAELETRAVSVVRSTIDSFHNPRQIRWRRGKDSPVGFYLDSHDLEAARTLLLDPLRSGTGVFTTAAFDEPSDSPVKVTPIPVQGDELLLFDGIFVQRPELADYWDLTIWLDGQQRVDLRRLGLVIEDLPPDPIEVAAHVLEWQRRIDRYSSGMRYYLDLVDPVAVADIVVDNNDLANPRIV